MCGAPSASSGSGSSAPSARDQRWTRAAVGCARSARASFPPPSPRPPPPPPPPADAGNRRTPGVSGSVRGLARPSASGSPGPLADPDTPGARAIARELMLIGCTTDEARDRVEKYLDDAFMAGMANVRLVHGKGTGALRKAVRCLLADHPLVDSYRDGEPNEGGSGATVAALKVS